MAEKRDPEPDRSIGPDWAGALDFLAERRAKANCFEEYCDKWSAAEGLAPIRVHLRQVEPRRLSSFGAAVEWLLKQRERRDPETDLPLLKALLAGGECSSAFRARLLCTACRDSRIVELVYVELISTADWAPMLDRFVDRQAKPAIVHRHCDEWSIAEGTEAIRRHLSEVPADRLQAFCEVVEWLLRRADRATAETARDLALAEKLFSPGHCSSSFRAALLINSCRFGDAETLQAVGASLMVNVDSAVAAERAETFRTLLCEAPRLSECDRELLRALFALRVGDASDIWRGHAYNRQEIPSPDLIPVAAAVLHTCLQQGMLEPFEDLLDYARKWPTKHQILLSALLARSIEENEQLLPTLTKTRAPVTPASAAPPQKPGKWTRTPIRSVGEICRQEGWAYEEVIGQSEIEVCPPRFFEARASVEAEPVVHPPIYKAELHNAVVHGGSWFIAAGGAGAYEPMQGPRADRFVHFDSVAVHGAGGHLLHRRVAPERRIAAGVWMVGVAAENYYHWLYDICSRALAYENFECFPEGAAVLVDEGALAIPQMVEILELLNVHKLPIEAVRIGEAVQVQRLFVAAPAAWSVTHLREGLSLEPLDSIIHPKAVSALRGIAAAHLRPIRPGRRIFVSRTNSLNPRIANEAELVALAQDEFGFELLDPSVLTFAEQVRAFSEAEAIISASGAAMSNLAFCSEGSKAFCLMAGAKWNWSGWQSIAAAAGCELMHIVSQPLPGFHFNEFHARFRSDPVQLREALQRNLPAAS